MTRDVALDFGHSMVRRFDVDWAGLGFSDDDLDELAEHLLRIIQSFVTDPGRPPRTRRETARLPAAVGRRRYTTVSGSDFLGANTNVEPPLTPHHRHLTQFLCRRVGLDHPCRPVGVGTCHLHIEVRVDGGNDGLQRAYRRPEPTSDTHAPSSCAGDLRTSTVSGPNSAVTYAAGLNIGCSSSVRIAPSIAAGQTERTMDAFGRDACDTGQLIGADLRWQARCPCPPACPTAMTNDRFSRCICRQTSSAIRTSAECENAAKSTSDTSSPE